MAKSAMSGKMLLIHGRGELVQSGRARLRPSRVVARLARSLVLLGTGPIRRILHEEDQPMTTISISLPDEMAAFVDAQTAREGYASASEIVRTLIREAQRRRARQELEAKLLEGLESGPDVEMTREDWVALRAEALEGLRGEDIRP
jgi:antitoxin ParD1/3/4